MSWEYADERPEPDDDDPVDPGTRGEWEAEELELREEARWLMEDTWRR